MPLALTAAASFEGGDGTKDDPYKIKTAAQLKKLADDVNGGNAYSGKYFELTEPIDLRGSEDNQWTPIGPDSSSKPFSGIFDGGGNKVSGLYINKENSDFQGCSDVSSAALSKTSA